MQSATSRKAIDTARTVAIAIILKLAIGVVAWLLLADIHRLATAPL
jgi:hypothetical protein